MIFLGTLKLQAQSLDRSAMDQVLLDYLRHIGQLHMTVEYTLRIYHDIRAKLAEVQTARLLRTHVDIEATVFYFFLKCLDQLHTVLLAAAGTLAIDTLIGTYEEVFIKFQIAFHG